MGLWKNTVTPLTWIIHTDWDGLLHFLSTTFKGAPLHTGTTGEACPLPFGVGISDSSLRNPSLGEPQCRFGAGTHSDSISWHCRPSPSIGPVVPHCQVVRQGDGVMYRIWGPIQRSFAIYSRLALWLVLLFTPLGRYDNYVKIPFNEKKRLSVAPFWPHEPHWLFCTIPVSHSQARTKRQGYGTWPSWNMFRSLFLLPSAWFQMVVPCCSLRSTDRWILAAVGFFRACSAISPEVNDIGLIEIIWARTFEQPSS